MADTLRCGECGGEIERGATVLHPPGRCVCGRRAVLRTGMGVTLVHAPECTGEDGAQCSCFVSLRVPPVGRSFLDDMRLCKSDVPRRDRK